MAVPRHTDCYTTHLVTKDMQDDKATTAASSIALTSSTKIHNEFQVCEEKYFRV